MAKYPCLLKVIRETTKRIKIKITGIYQMKAKKVYYKLESNFYLNFEIYIFFTFSSQTIE